MQEVGWSSIHTKRNEEQTVATQASISQADLVRCNQNFCLINNCIHKVLIGSLLQKIAAELRPSVGKLRVRKILFNGECLLNLALYSQGNSQ